MFFRDYGVYDLPMLRFPVEQRIADRVYARGDGTLAHFFTRAGVRDYFRHAGFVEGGELGQRSAWSREEGGVGGVEEGGRGGMEEVEDGSGGVDAVRYCCVHNENKRKGLLMRRVFVHGTWTKPLV